MLSNHSIFFSILLLFSFSTFVTINGAEAVKKSSYIESSSRDNCSEFIREKLVDLGLNASDTLRKDLVTITEGHDDSDIDFILRTLQNEISQNTSFEALCYKTPLDDERAEIIQKMLSRRNKNTTTDFMKKIIELTTDRTMLQMHTFLSMATKKSDSELLNRQICLEELEIIISNSNNKQENQKEKIARLQILQKSIQEGHVPSYPSLKHMVHPKIELFRRIAKQLNIGKFEDGFRRGMIFYGPSGVGKTEMVTALVNESGCKLFKIATSQLDNQQNRTETIIKIFSQAKKEKTYKGIIIFIDNLTSLIPETSNLIWEKFNECKAHNNTLTIIACKEFKTINENVCKEFSCIEFSKPDQNACYEILKIKAEHLNLELPEEVLKEHAERKKDWNGRELNSFICCIYEHVDPDKKNLEEAIKKAVEEQENRLADNEENRPANNIFEEIRKQLIKLIRETISNNHQAIVGAAITSFTGATATAYRYFTSSSTNPSNNNTTTDSNPVDPAPEIPNTVNYGPPSEAPRLDLPTRSINNANLNTDLNERLKKFNQFSGWTF